MQATMIEATLQSTRWRLTEKRQFKQATNGGADMLYNVEDPGPNDVLFGRGTGSNLHSGNIKFRALIQRYKPIYRDTPKKMKPSVSTKVVALWRAQDPPGRFLTRSDRFNGTRRSFYDVGDAMARRKAAQCLREKSSKERFEMHYKSAVEERRAREDEDEDDETHWGVHSDSSLADDIRDAPTTTNEAELNITFSDLADGMASANSSNEILGRVADSSTLFSFSMNSSFEFNLKNTMDGNDNSEFKLPPSSKSLSAKKETSWYGAGKLEKAVISLMDVYAAESDESVGDQQQRCSSDSPFLFASFDLGNNASSGDGSGDHGLCFPSLLGRHTTEDSGTTSSSLFGDDDGYHEDHCAFPSLASLTPSEPNRRDDALQTIRDTMPTAAVLTTGLFDF